MGQPRNPKYDTAVIMYESGMSIATCAKHFGVTRQTMHAALVRRGCKFRDNLRFGEENHFYRGSRPYKKSRKARAHDITEKAILKGKLINPGKCSECNQPRKAKDGRSLIYAHHDDYKFPLKVRWLCVDCHHEWHKHNKPLNE